MKINITGITGFVGQNLKSFFESDGFEVRGITLRNDCWKGSLDGSAILHLAGKAHDTTNTAEPEEYFKVNRELTISLFDEFMKSDVEDFFFFSSVKAVADTINGVLVEDAICDPFTAYGKSKLEAENYLLSKRLPRGKRLFIIRPCMIHGPGNKGNLNLLYKVVSRGFPWPLASFSNQRSFISIDNLSYVLRRMIEEKNVKSGVYNVADDKPISTNELVSLISQNFDRKPKLWYIPKSVVHLIAKVGNMFSLPLNSERLKKLTESYVVSNAKIKEALGIEEMPFSVKEGLEKTIKSFGKDVE